MFCFKCQETAGNRGCTVKGACGKTEQTAGLQDLLVHAGRGISFRGIRLRGMENPAGSFEEDIGAITAEN